MIHDEYEATPVPKGFEYFELKLAEIKDAKRQLRNESMEEACRKGLPHARLRYAMPHIENRKCARLTLQTSTANEQ